MIRCLSGNLRSHMIIDGMRILRNSSRSSQRRLCTLQPPFQFPYLPAYNTPPQPPSSTTKTAANPRIHLQQTNTVPKVGIKKNERNRTSLGISHEVAYQEALSHKRQCCWIATGPSKKRKKKPAQKSRIQPALCSIKRKIQDKHPSSDIIITGSWSMMGGGFHGLTDRQP